MPPRMDGLTLIKSLRSASYQRVPILVDHGIQDDMKAKGRAAGANGLVGKTI